MGKVDILCPACGKLLLKVAADSEVVAFCWCRRCRQEKQITYRAKEPPKK